MLGDTLVGFDVETEHDVDRRPPPGLKRSGQLPYRENVEENPAEAL
jgi:hypothetical protein